MLETLRLIFKEHMEYLKQIPGLALTDIRKDVRGAGFGWIWLFVKPAIYILVFWFALEVGLRAGKTTGGDGPFMLWLAAGLFPWFFMQTMINTGSNVYSRYSYLVNKLHFPVSVISTFYTLAQLLVNMALVGIVVVVCLVTGLNRSIYLLQVPVIYLVMFLFWTLFSLMTSPLSALSKDFANLMKVLSTPLFWLSGIIFNVRGLDIPILQTILAFDPVASFATAFRDAIYYQQWVWESPDLYLPFVFVFALTAVCALYFFHRTRKDIADVL